MDKIYFVYCLTFSNNKVYIGMSTTCNKGLFTNRFRQHRTVARSGKFSPLYNAWRKYGDPIQTILSIYDSRYLCALAEIAAIQQYDSINPEKGYNIASGGQGLHYENNPLLYELMRIKVWDNAERRKKCSDALKGRKPSQATIDASNEWKSSEAGKETFRRAWENHNRKEKASKLTKKQMANGGSENLSKTMIGREDIRSDAGKEAQKQKVTAFMNSKEGKQVAKRGYQAMSANPENLKKWKEGTNRWRATEANKENCKRMAQLSAQKNSKKVMLNGQIFDSQHKMAQTLNVSDACVSLWVKEGKVTRI